MVQLMILFKEQSANPQGWCARPETTPQSKHNGQPPRLALLWSALIGLLALLMRLGGPVTRHWLANICILGGILATPVVSVVAWIGLALPTQAVLHQIAPMLVAGSLVWFGVAIACAHACRFDRLDHHDDV